MRALTPASSAAVTAAYRVVLNEGEGQGVQWLHC